MRLQKSPKFEWFEYLLMGCGWALLAAVLSVWIGIDLVSAGSAFLATIFLFFVPATLIGFSAWIWFRVRQPPISPGQSIANQIGELSDRMDKIERKLDDALRLFSAPIAGEGEGEAKWDDPEGNSKEGQ